MKETKFVMQEAKIFVIPWMLISILVAIVIVIIVVVKMSK